MPYSPSRLGHTDAWNQYPYIAFSDGSFIWTKYGCVWKPRGAETHQGCLQTCCGWHYNSKYRILIPFVRKLHQHILLLVYQRVRMPCGSTHPRGVTRVASARQAVSDFDNLDEPTDNTSLGLIRHNPVCPVGSWSSHRLCPLHIFSQLPHTL